MKKLLLIQIDGLASPYFDKALSQGLLPFTKRLLRQGWIKREIFCGLPSTTPASQMSLLYGLDNIIPGFRFLVKKEHFIFKPTKSKTMKYIEDYIAKYKTKPLLKDGATVFIQFTGGSKRSISFTTIANDKKIIMPFLRYVSNPWHVLVYFIKVGVMCVIDKLENQHVYKQNIKRSTNKIIHLLKRVITELSVGELAAYFTEAAIKKHEPVIYANFPGYDTLAHYYGPTSIFSFNYLTLVDIYLKHIYSQMKRSGEEYEVVIFSDHGQSPSVFQLRFAGSLLRDQLQQLYPSKKIVEHGEGSDKGMVIGTDLYLLDSGGLSLVYAPKQDGCLTKSELETEFPHFCRQVSQLPGIGFILTVNNHEPVISYKGASLSLSLKSMESVLSFASAAEQKLLIRQLIKLIHSPFAADAYIFANVLEDGKVISFENQVGTHGGLGGAQTRSFILSRVFSFQPGTIRDFADLNKLFYSYIYDQKA